MMLQKQLYRVCGRSGADEIFIAPSRFCCPHFKAILWNFSLKGINKMLPTVLRSKAEILILNVAVKLS